MYGWLPYKNSTQTPVALKKDMKTTSTLKRKTPLKSYSHLTAKVSIQSPFSMSKPLKRSSLKRKHTPATPQGVLDAIFSQCIRRGNADYRGYVTCATCSQVGHWREFDNGHFQVRGNMATRYDPRNCAPQCISCNRIQSKIDENGDEYDAAKEIEAEFAEYIDRVHGAGVADDLRALAKTIVCDFPYDRKIAEWTDVLNSLIAKGGNDIQY